MTNPTKAWSMLTARGVRPGGAFGGRPDLTPSEIARMLKGLERRPYLTGMVKECGDVTLLPALERALFFETMKLADPIDQDGKPIPELAWPLSHGQAYCRRMAGLAVLEFLIPKPVKCEDCNGRGWKRREGQGVACAECSAGPSDPRIPAGRRYNPNDDDPGSTGYRRMNDTLRAELAGIPFRSWKDGWAERYELVYRSIGSWHSIADGHLRRALRERRESLVI